jgi:putative (di)nucleoside polyphosphate hydrolase
MTDPRPIFQAVPPPGYRRNVGIMLLNHQGFAWVGQRLDRSGDAWQMPQGGIDDGESPAEAALRELAEEIGTVRAEILCETPGWLSYDLPADLARQIWNGRWRGQTQRWFALRFTGSDHDIDIATAHPEFATWRWLPRAELPRVIVPFKRPIYEAVVAEFEPNLRALGF